MRPVIWLDAVYSVREAAALCDVGESVIRWALVDKRLASDTAGLIPGIELFKFFKYQRFNGLNGDVK